MHWVVPQYGSVCHFLVDVGYRVTVLEIIRVAFLDSEYETKRLVLSS